MIARRPSGEQTQTTYRELRDRAHRAALLLATRGIKPGDRVLLIGENSPDWVLGYFAILCAGAIAVPLDHLISAEELVPICKIAEPAAALRSSTVHQRPRLRAQERPSETDRARRRGARASVHSARRCEDATCATRAKGTRFDPVHQWQHRRAQGRDAVATLTSPPKSRCCRACFHWALTMSCCRCCRSIMRSNSPAGCCCRSPAVRRLFIRSKSMGKLYRGRSPTFARPRLSECRQCGRRSIGVSSMKLKGAVPSFTPLSTTCAT